MKKLVQVQEVNGEGLLALLGQRIQVFCMNYIYAGTLEGVNTNDIMLSKDDASIVYETGPFTSDKFTDAQKIGSAIYIRTNSIESYHVTSKK